MNRLFVTAIAILLLALLPGCDRDNPLAPEVTEYPDPELSAATQWYPAELPVSLQGEWWLLAKHQFTIRSDSLFRSPDGDVIRDDSRFLNAWKIEGVETTAAREFYRLILYQAREGQAGYFGMLCLRVRTEQVLQAVAVAGFKRKETVLSPSVVEIFRDWQTLNHTRQADWQPIPVDSALIGRRISADQSSHLVVNDREVSLGSQSWTLMGARSNGYYNSLLLRSAEGWQVLYYRSANNFHTLEEIGIALSAGRAASLDDALNLPAGPWTNYSTTVVDLMEYLPLREGASWTYSYEAEWQASSGSNALPSYVSSSTHERAWGKFTVRVADAREEGSRLVVLLETTARMDSLSIHRYSQQWPDSPISDTSYTITPEPEFLTHQLVLENDSLWYEVPEGRRLFSGRWLQSSPNRDLAGRINMVNFSLFNYRGFTMPAVPWGVPVMVPQAEWVDALYSSMGSFEERFGGLVKLTGGVGLEELETKHTYHAGLSGWSSFDHQLRLKLLSRE